MSKTIRTTLLSAPPDFTASEHRIAAALLERYPSLGLLPIAEVAEVAGVSAPTVFRFALKLGFDSYSAFQQALHAEIDAAMNSPLSRMDMPRSELSGEPTPASMLDRLTDSLQDTKAHFDEAAFGRAVALLSDERLRVHCGGGRYSSFLASSLAYSLAYTRPNVALIQPDLASSWGILADIGPGDLLLLLDFRRYQESVIEFAATAHRQGARILLLTDEWMSPIGAFAEVVLRVHGRPYEVLESSVPALALCEMLVISMVSRQPELARQRMERVEALLHMPPARERDEHGNQREG